MDANKDAETLTLIPQGDMELWYAEPADKLWRLPVYVRWHSSPSTSGLYGVIEPALCFYTNQHLAMRALLEPHNISEDKTRWILHKSLVHHLLLKAEGITPSCNYRWMKGHPPLPIQFNPRQIRLERPLAQRDEKHRCLAEFISKEKGLPPDVVVLVLTALGQVGSRWMIQFRQPIDLGFCKLIALPFRSNWKEIVAFKCKHWPFRTMLSMTAQKRRLVLQMAGFQEIITSMQNTALDATMGGHRLDYTLEATPTRDFAAEVDRTEQLRMRISGTSYIAFFQETVERMYEHILDALYAHLQKAAKPFGKILSRGTSGSTYISPAGDDNKHVRFRNRNLRRLPVHIVEDDPSFRVSTEQGDPQLVCAPANALPEVFGLPQKATDLRKRKVPIDVEQPREE